jgi:hypothetical protein
MSSVEVEPVACTHCGGSGYEPVGPTPEEREALLAQLREAGDRRATYSAHRTLAGRQELAAAYQDIRVLAAEAGRLGITKLQIAEAVGLKRAALYNVLTGKTGG